MTSDTTARGVWSPWRTVVAFGVVSLAADVVYEGLRSVTGPFLASLGASALLVGVVTGAGEGVALALRLLTGPAADRSGRHWRFTTVGYAMTAVSVPLLALTPALGAAGLAVACALVLVERTGKAVRSPSKSALLAGVAKDVGRGRGFAVHKALDQVGAFAGPLLVAGVAALAGGRLWAGLLVLGVPGVVSIVLLAQVRRRAPVADDPPRAPAAPSAPADHQREPLPRSFWALAVACGASTVGLMTFGVISFALVDNDAVAATVVPLVYAGAMAVEAVAALATGALYDRIGSRVLLALPFLVAPVPALLLGSPFGTGPTVVALGMALWALATGVQDSTVKAHVAALVPASSLGRAYGSFAALQGGAALAGGALAGALYQQHAGLLVVGLACLQVVALALLVRAVSRSH